MSVQATIHMLGTAVVNWDVGADKSPYDMSECRHGDEKKPTRTRNNMNSVGAMPPCFASGVAGTTSGTDLSDDVVTIIKSDFLPHCSNDLQHAEALPTPEAVCFTPCRCRAIV